MFKDFTLLYVEDNSDMRGFIEVLFKDYAKEFFSASNGLEGLEIYKKKRPDIIISDIDMPKMSGLEMSRAIKKIDKNQIILLMSGMYDDSLQQELLQIGIDLKFVIRKPISDINLIFDLLNQIMSKED